jgi:hypothetical protein
MTKTQLALALATGAVAMTTLATVASSAPTPKTQVSQGCCNSSLPIHLPAVQSALGTPKNMGATGR